MYVADSRGATAARDALRHGPRAAAIAPTVFALGAVSLITDISSEMITAVLPLYLVAGLGLGRLTVGDDATPTPDAPDSVVAAADLTALDSSAGRGVARAVRPDDTLTLRVEARGLGDEDGFHEVWLINVDGTRMVALGVLADGDTGEFQVPRGLLDEGYRIVDISVEPDDGDPTHSGVSLARGELA